MALTAACGPHTRTYRCEGGSVVTADQRGDVVHLTLPDTTVVLPQVRSADGMHYGDATYSFWPRGDSALVMRGDLVVYRNCIGAE
jgi:membrane-bound inhibitor of C-type lysozyme